MNLPGGLLAALLLTFALSFAISRPADAQTTLAPIAIPASTPTGYPRIRGGIGIGGGVASTVDYGAVFSAGPGLLAHFGVQASPLVGAYVSLRGYSLVFFSHLEADAMVDFTLFDRLQVGAGFGAFMIDNPRIFESGTRAARGFVVPVHIAIDTSSRPLATGGRRAFQIALDAGPAVAIDSNGSTHPAFTAALDFIWYWR